MAGLGILGEQKRVHSVPHPIVSIPVAVALVVGLGLALIYAATRATATVEDGRTFIRWMLVVFLCFLLLASLPVVIAF